ncbi:MAG: hypothetical protein Q7W02_19785 [Candidatus Rokubacteria bacterium]|nr:hypothetical protein [Candidatus Rokubacteria bacterium]
MFTVPANFIGTFKTGDNINYNLRLLAVLYRHYEEANAEEQSLLCKPIILILVSIIEAILHDFHMRIRVFTIEGVKTLADSVIAYIQGKDPDELETYIASARKHNLFEMANLRFYDILTELRKLRNRIHIQNTKGLPPPDEHNAFTQAKTLLAEKALERVVKKMAEKYPRGEHVSGFVGDFVFPWLAHFA